MSRNGIERDQRSDGRECVRIAECVVGDSRGPSGDYHEVGSDPAVGDGQRHQEDQCDGPAVGSAAADVDHGQVSDQGDDRQQEPKRAVHQAGIEPAQRGRDS